MIEAYLNHTPKYAHSTWIHSSAVVIGSVSLAAEVSVWPTAVLRGDVNFITVGKRSNIQDGAVIHGTTPNPLNPEGYATIIGDEVTIGHGAILHGCTIGNRVLIGMSATILDGSVIPDNTMVGACAFVPMGKTLESGYLYLGAPAKKVRLLTKEELEFLKHSATHYVQLKNNYNK